MKSGDRQPRAGALGVTAAALVLGLLGSWAVQRLAGDQRPERASGAPQRVILFAPNLNEAAWVMGFGDRVVAVDDYTVWPLPLLSRPRVGGMVDPNLERILALAPDLLVVQGESPLLRGLARENGIRLGSVTMDENLESVLAGFGRLDSLLAPQSPVHAAPVVARIRADLAAIAQSAAAQPRPRTLLVLGRERDRLTTVWTSGRGTFLTDLLAIAGATSLSAQQPRPYLELSAEALLADPPAVVIELRPGERVDAAARAAAERVWRAAGFGSVRVELCGFDGAQIPGARVAQTAARLFAALHPGVAPPPLTSVAEAQESGRAVPAASDSARERRGLDPERGMP